MQNFLVRRSTDTKTALSVKLGAEHGFEVDHFILKEEGGKVSIETSSLVFDTILSLIYHYTTHGYECYIILISCYVVVLTGVICLSS